MLMFRSMDSLFSFGVYVDDISGLDDECVQPSVAFRLLDYPTVVIQSSPIVNNNNNNDNNDNNPCKKRPFKKGKSCLFKHNVNDLKGAVKRVPLYLMVFDELDKTSTLKGCCSIPLDTLFHKMELRMKKVCTISCNSLHNDSVLACVAKEIYHLSYSNSHSLSLTVILLLYSYSYFCSYSYSNSNSLNSF